MYRRLADLAGGAPGKMDVTAQIEDRLLFIDSRANCLTSLMHSIFLPIGASIWWRVGDKHGVLRTVLEHAMCLFLANSFAPRFRISSRNFSPDTEECDVTNPDHISMQHVSGMPIAA